MNAPTTTSESTALTVAVQQPFSLQPRSFDEAWNLATMIANTDMAPKDYQGKPERCMVAIQWGDEVGLKPLQSVQNIAVINGRPSLWGDSMLAIVRASPLCKYFIERWEGAGDSLKAVCRTHRAGEPEEQVREFSMDDARKANLLGRDTYKQYGKRMLQMRARGWLIRDVYTDLIRGLHMAEEAMDMPPPEKFMGPADVVQPTAAAPAATAPTLPTYPADQFAANFPKWKAAIEAGKKAPHDVIATVESKFKLAEEQKAQILSVKKKEQATDATPKGEEFAVTYARVAGDLEKAKDRDAFLAAGDLIKHIKDEGQRAEAQAIFDRREPEFKE